MSNTFVFSFDYSELSSYATISPFNSFTIIHEGERYKVNPFIASSYSKKISSLIMENILSDEITLTTGPGPIDLIIDYLNCKEIDFDASQAEFILEVSIELCIDTLIERSVRLISTELAPKQIFDYALRAFEQGAVIDPLTKLLEPHICDLIKENAFANTSEAFIDLVLKYSKNVPSDVLIPFLMKYFNFVKAPNHRLAKYYPFSAIPQNVAANILKNPNVNIYRYMSLLPQINELLIPKTNIANTIPYNPGHEFDGLMSKMFYPAITSSSLEHGTLESLLLGKDYFVSKPEDNPWLVFDFKMNTICVLQYTISVLCQIDVGVTPYKWILEASSNQENWVTIDERECDLSKPPGIFVFTTEMHSFHKFIRFTQLKSNPEKDKRLAIDRIEFFGQFHN